MTSVVATKEVTLYLDSELSNSGSRSNAIFQIDQIKVNSFKISDFSLYNVVYTVNSSNNLINLTYNQHAYNILLETGFFENDNLSDNIQNSINTALGISSIQVQYDPVVAKFTITGFPSTVYYDSNISTCDILLGLTQDQSGTTLMSDSISETVPVDYVYITSTAISSMISTIIPNTAFNTVIEKFVINNNSGYLIQLSDVGLRKHISQNNTTLANIDIQIVDKFFKPIPQQTRWSMTIIFDQILSTSSFNSNNFNPSNNNFNPMNNYGPNNFPPNNNFNNYGNDDINNNNNQYNRKYAPIKQGIIDLDYR